MDGNDERFDGFGHEDGYYGATPSAWRGSREDFKRLIDEADYWRRVSSRAASVPSTASFTGSNDGPIAARGDAGDGARAAEPAFVGP
jgi:hypothetical protein